MNHRITVVGTGYVGLVTGACLSDFGLEVICVDKDRDKIETLKRGVVPFYEPGLENLVNKNSSAGRLTFSNDIKAGIENSDVLFIAVGTPPKENGSADIQHVEDVARDIATYMNGYKVIVNKSTVPIGTVRLVEDIIKRYQKQPFEFDVVSNPEFLREGAAVYDFMHPDRVVIGTDNERAVSIMKGVYRVLFLNQKTPFLFTDPESAETIKYAANAFLAMKVTYVNEMAALCEKTGADIVSVARGMGMDGRIGNKFLNPGPGYGGSCFPKDTRALVNIAHNYGVTMSLIEATITANENQKKRILSKIEIIVGELHNKNIGVLGLAFKAETDDTRESPALSIVSDLARRGAYVKVYDPKAMDQARVRLSGLDNVQFCENEYTVAEGVEALIIMTEWNQFRGLDLARIKASMKKALFFDLRNIFEPGIMRKLGFEYYSVGRS